MWRWSLTVRHRLTFGLIVQPDHVADVFELGQLVNLDAAARGTLGF